MDDDPFVDVVAEMGLADPDGPIVPSRRVRFEQTDAEVDQRKRKAVATAAAQHATEIVGDWVDKALAWTPMVDLHQRVVVPAYAVESFILQGKVGALVAGGGTGKTTLKLYLAVCIATGRRFFGLAVTQGT